MPNHPAMTGALVVASLAFAAAVAIYESPQARQLAEDLRRKIAIALHSLGDEIDPRADNIPPRFNRPEDAEGFYTSHRNVDSELEADADSQRRQRDEIMHWNALKIAREREERERQERELNDRERHQADHISSNNTRDGPSFDHFLMPDKNEEKGTYVYHSGADPNSMARHNLRNRARRCSVSDADPFSDEHNIEINEDSAKDASLMVPDENDKELLSDIQNDIEMNTIKSDMVVPESIFIKKQSSATSQAEINASIHSWAETANAYPNSELNNHSTLYSSNSSLTRNINLNAPGISSSGHYEETSIPGDGDVTPTDSGSTAGSVEIMWGPHSNTQSEDEAVDVMSISEVASTSGTWTEVGSVVSENDSM